MASSQTPVKVSASSAAASNHSPSTRPSAYDNEHIDSPLRKKPRLHVGGEDDLQRAHSKTTPPTTPSHEAPPTPSKMTLNLKTSHLNSSPSSTPSAQPHPASPTAMDPSSSAHGVQIELEFPGEERSSSSRSDSPPTIVEIDPSDGEENTVLHATPAQSERVLSSNSNADLLSSAAPEQRLPPQITMAGIEDIESNHLLAFQVPPYNSRNPVTNVAALAKALAQGEIGLPAVDNVLAWMEDWLQLVKDERPRWATIYSAKSRFWSHMAELANAFLIRRAPFNNRQDTETVTPAFFARQLELAYHHICLDLDAFRRGNTEAADTVSSQWMLVLDRILTQPNPQKSQAYNKSDEYSVPFWHNCIHQLNVDPRHIQRETLMIALNESKGLFTALLDLAKALLPGLRTSSSGHSTFNSLIQTISSILSIFSDASQDESQAEMLQLLNPLKTRLSHAAAELVRDCALVVTENLEQAQDATFRRDLAIRLCTLQLHACRLDRGVCKEILSSRIGTDVDEFSVDDYPSALFADLGVDIFLKLIHKARMELRIQGVANLGDHLVQVYYMRGGPSAQSGDPVITFLAGRLRRAKVIEFLVGAESHHQLISRSANILGFLLVTKQWTDSMTDALWQTLTECPDQRLRHDTALIVNNQAINQFNPTELLHLCQHYQLLPLQKFDLPLRQLLDNIVPRIQGPVQKESEMQIAEVKSSVVALVMRLTRESFMDDKVAINHIFEEWLQVKLKELCDIVDDDIVRRQIYKECADDMRLQSSTVTGSMRIVTALITHRLPADGTLVFDELGVFSALVEEICSFVRRISQKSDQEQHQYNFNFSFFQRVQLLRLCILDNTRTSRIPGGEETGTSIAVKKELCSRLWEALFGDPAIDARYRETAWQRLVEIIRYQTGSNLLLDELALSFIPSLDPDVVTDSTVDFIEAFIRSQTVSRNTSSTSGAARGFVAMINTLWQISMATQNNSIYRKTFDFLISLCLTKDLLGADATFVHEAIVARCFQEIAPIISSLTSIDSQKSSDSEMQLSQDDKQQVIRFGRVFIFLQRILIETRNNPAFQLPQAARSPSPRLKLKDIDDVDNVVIKYQLGLNGTLRDVQEAQIPETSTLRDLVNLISAMKQVKVNSVIFRGATLDQESIDRITAKECVGEGLLIIRADGGHQGKLLQGFSPASVIDEEIMKRMASLLPLLDLPSDYSRSVLRLLRMFPPHASLVRAVESRSDSEETAFHFSSPSRVIYNIWTMRLVLQELVRFDKADKDFLRYGLQRFETTFCDDRLLKIDLDVPEVKGAVLDAIEAFHAFFQESSSIGVSKSFEDEALLTKQILALIGEMIENDSHEELACIGLSALLDLANYNQLTLQVFADASLLAKILSWLLLRSPNPAIRNATRDRISTFLLHTESCSAGSSAKISMILWKVLVALIPTSLDHQVTSRDFWLLAKGIFTANQSRLEDESTLRGLFASWTQLLLDLPLATVPGKFDANPAIFGIAELIITCVSQLKTLKKLVGGEEALRTIMDRFLIPPSIDDPTEIAPDNGTVQLMLDDATRQSLYSLALMLCEDETTLLCIIECFESALTQERLSVELPRSSSADQWLRSYSGYLGLENLTNTCYMNSLMTQLFMTVPFRNFILRTPVPDQLQGRKRQSLLAATQALFTTLITSHAKYAETEQFAGSIEPYEGEKIDVSSQMDVEEFYNLIFERLEGQMPTGAAKQELRSFFGGQLITQIKSLDCEHVSERLEDCATIQCEVHGKTDLLESLDSYVKGDTMQGENKYKCEACGGRLVDAVKRTCVNNLSDHLIISLKRFDYDLDTYQRRKINDYFAFPMEIDMARYNLETQQNGVSHSHDMFELAGVLVHTGSADSGHYYSYIRDSARANDYTWHEFNDTEVRPFDPAKLSEQCFGGPWSEMTYDKPFNAYMLFYRRKSAAQDLPIQPAYPFEQSRKLIPHETLQAMTLINDSYIRRYCLLEPRTVQFIRNLLSKSQQLNLSGCSDSHSTENRLINVVLQHGSSFLARMRESADYEKLLETLQKTCFDCPLCIQSTLEWFSLDGDHFKEAFFGLPKSIDNVVFPNFVHQAFSAMKKNFPEEYAIATEPNSSEHTDSEERSPFLEFIVAMKDMMASIGEHARHWAPYFETLYGLCQLGFTEKYLLLREGFLEDIVQILHAFDVENVFPADRVHRANYRAIRNVKQQFVNWKPVVRVLCTFLESADWSLAIEEDLITPRGMAEAYNSYDRHSKRERARLEAIQIDSITPKYPLVHYEKSIITWGTEQMELFAKIVDMSDPVFSVRFVEAFFNCGIDKTARTLLYGAVLKAVGDFHSAYMNQALRPAAAYCAATENTDEVTEICRRALAMIPSLEIKGVSHMTDFFNSVFHESNSWLLNRDSHRVFRVVLSLLANDITDLLQQRNRSLQIQIYGLLDATMFLSVPLPDHPHLATELFGVRVMNIRTLRDRCLLILQRLAVSTEGLRQNAGILEVAKRCVDWMDLNTNNIAEMDGLEELDMQLLESDEPRAQQIRDLVLFANATEDVDGLVDDRIETGKKTKNRSVTANPRWKRTPLKLRKTRVGNNSSTPTKTFGLSLNIISDEVREQIDRAHAQALSLEMAFERDLEMARLASLGLDYNLHSDGVNKEQNTKKRKRSVSAGSGSISLGSLGRDTPPCSDTEASTKENKRQRLHPPATRITSEPPEDKPSSSDTEGSSSGKERKCARPPVTKVVTSESKESTPSSSDTIDANGGRKRKRSKTPVTKDTSTSQKGSVEDPIDIEEPEESPTKKLKKEHHHRETGVYGAMTLQAACESTTTDPRAATMPARSSTEVVYTYKPRPKKGNEAS